VVIALAKQHAAGQTLKIGQYINQIDEIAAELAVPIIKGETPTKDRENLFAQFPRGELKCIVVPKVANFSIDLPEASIAIQVSVTFGSRQEEAQRLSGILRPKADGRTARFYSVVARDTIDQDFAQNRQRFLAEQGYSYRIIDADEEFPKSNSPQ
jgi:DNA excision repair protein ERCC-3